MIFEILFFIIFGLLSALVFWLPGYGDVPLHLPWGIDPLFVQMSRYFHGAIDTLPYLEVVLVCFGYALLFELGMMFLKLFLGSRAPHHN